MLDSKNFEYALFCGDVVINFYINNLSTVMRLKDEPTSVIHTIKLDNYSFKHII